MHSLTIFCSLAITLIALVDAGDKEIKFKSHMMRELVQKPIFYSGEMRRVNRDMNEPCQFSSDCNSGCCLKEKNGGRRCNRKSKVGEPCSVSQVKLDMYMEYCPCESGNRFCSDGPKRKCLD